MTVGAVARIVKEFIRTGDEMVSIGVDTGSARSADARAASFPWMGIGLALIATVLSVLAARGDFFRYDPAVARWVQGMGGSGLDGLAEAVSWVGLWAPSLVVIGLVAGAIARAGDPVGAWFVIGAALLRPVNLAIKWLVDRPRPTAEVVRVLEVASGLGFPSGHAFSAMALCVVTAGVMPRVMSGTTLRIAQAISIGLGLLMGWSRVRLGAHWPSDVLGGWLCGAAMGLLLLWSLPLVDRWREGRLRR